jgi:hypothetical protein
MARPVWVARRMTHTGFSAPRLVGDLAHLPIQEPSPASREMTVRLEPTGSDSLGSGRQHGTVSSQGPRCNSSGMAQLGNMRAA